MTDQIKLQISRSQHQERSIHLPALNRSTKHRNSYQEKTKKVWRKIMISIMRNCVESRHLLAEQKSQSCRSYLLVVQFLGLPRFEELQQVPQRSLIVVSERIPWTVPVPGHHTTRQGGRTTKGRKERWRERRNRVWDKGAKEEKKRGRLGKQEGKTKKFRDAEAEWRRSGERKEDDGEEAEWEELEENNKERWGGTGYATFLLTTASNQIKSKCDTFCEKTKAYNKLKRQTQFVCQWLNYVLIHFILHNIQPFFRATWPIAWNNDCKILVLVCFSVCVCVCVCVCVSVSVYAFVCVWGWDKPPTPVIWRTAAAWDLCSTSALPSWPPDKETTQTLQEGILTGLSGIICVCQLRCQQGNCWDEGQKTFNPYL